MNILRGFCLIIIKPKIRNTVSSYECLLFTFYLTWVIITYNKINYNFLKIFRTNIYK